MKYQAAELRRIVPQAPGCHGVGGAVDPQGMARGG